MVVVRAGSVGHLESRLETDLVGQLLVSKCVCVYWHDDHCCYYGSVTGWNGAAHTVVYEDGDVVTEKLGGANAPYWMVTTI